MKIVVTKSAEKTMRKMDKVTRNRVIAAVNRIPLGNIKRLRGYDNNFRLRVGDYTLSCGARPPEGNRIRCALWV